jgi:glycerophosphoryl diester phosphodiesterase
MLDRVWDTCSGFFVVWIHDLRRRGRYTYVRLALRPVSLPAFALLSGVLALLSPSMDAAEQKPIVVAHRGACGYLPEHTLAAKAAAFAMGADYIEQDVVLTKDDQPIVLHDIHLDTVTDVARVFPDRRRDDGRYYAADLTLDEIKRLKVHERIDLETGQAVFPARFPVGKAVFRIPTLAEEIELIQGLNQSTGREVGIYTEIKKPAWHRTQGKDISRIVLRTLNEYGYRTKQDKCYVQCFDPQETRRIRRELECPLRLVQLIADNEWHEADADFDQLRTPEGIRQIAEYADGIGPAMPHVVRGLDDSGKPILTDLVDNAHAVGLEVHPFTLRADALPKYADNFEEALRIFFDEAHVDGIFTDFPDRAVAFLNR